jgi:hypothetical protein
MVNKVISQVTAQQWYDFSPCYDGSMVYRWRRGKGPLANKKQKLTKQADSESGVFASPSCRLSGVNS